MRLPISELTTKIARVRDQFALFSRAVRDPYPVVVNGIGAHFRVENVDELWRHRDLREERPILEALLSELDEGDVFWDVGANVGSHSVLSAVAGADVQSFEPHPLSRARLVENAKLNDVELSVHDIALGRARGTMALTDGGNHAVGTHRLSDNGEISVEVAPADEVSAPTPDVIKIDVEGGELSVLDGASNTLSSARWIIVECHTQHGVETDEVRSRLEPHFDIVEDFGDVKRDEPFLLAYGE